MGNVKRLNNKEGYGKLPSGQAFGDKEDPQQSMEQVTNSEFLKRYGKNVNEEVGTHLGTNTKGGYG